MIPEHLQNYDLGAMRVYSELRGVIDANWKIALEAFIEFYHSDDTHPQILPISATLKSQYDLYKNGMSRMIIPIGYSGDRSSDPDKVTEMLKGFVEFFGGNNEDYKNLKGQEYRKALADTLRKWGKRNGYEKMFNGFTDGQLTDDWNYHVFPTITLNMFSYGALIQSWTPHPTDPEKHIYRAVNCSCRSGTRAFTRWILRRSRCRRKKAGPALSGQSQRIRRRPRNGEPCCRRMWSACRRCSRACVHAVYEGHRLCESESRLRHYLAEIDRYLAMP